MRSDNSQLLWKDEEHPPLEVLREYQEESLPKPESRAVERHLISCELCTDLVQGMKLSDRKATRKAVHDLNAQLRILGPKKRQRRLPLIPLLDWRAAATILVLLCSVGLVVYFIYGEIQRERLAAARKAELAAQAELLAISATTDTLFITVPGPTGSTAAATTATAPAVAYQKPVTRKPSAASASKTEARAEASANAAYSEAAAGMVAGVAVQDKTEVKHPDTALSKKPGELTASAPAVVRSKTESVGNVVVEAGKQLKGQVVSEQGEGIPGVSVVVKGTSKGTSTDRSGNFTLPAPTDNTTLSFNYIGYQQEEVKVDPKTNTVKIELTPDNKALNEVVVIGYGTTMPEAAAAPVTGMKAYNQYIEKNRRTPAAATSEKISGRVVVGFTVTAKGTLENIRILKSLHPAADAEALRLVKEGPPWKPAVKNGKTVPQEVKMRIRFKPE
ncbi:energy transducer TonB [Botryobacter ruber]|uniref:energy transducer TonB n=1 Tax=Botryobacter ruber TaxID=2171629 RepID=UPI000E0A9211|nr:energy transducer TonB [Botryobacter ruber]